MTHMSTDQQLTKQDKNTTAPNCSMGEPPSIQKILHTPLLTIAERARQIFSELESEALAQEVLDHCVKVHPEQLMERGVLESIVFSEIHLIPLGIFPPRSVQDDDEENSDTQKFFASLHRRGATARDIVIELLNDSSGIRFALAPPTLSA